jgi:NAD(P)H-hydrate epimerase
MKKIVTPAEMQDIDRRTIHEFKIAGQVLMENAGNAVFKTIKDTFDDLPQKNIFVFCGKGNNGGDGFVIGRLLKENGATPKVFVNGNHDDIKMDARIHFNKLIATGVEPVFISETFDFPQSAPDLIVDALLGTGARGPLEKELLKAVETINRWRDEFSSYVLAVDIPSGLNGETGRAENVSVHADATVTMGLPKTGLLFGNGKQYTGSLHIADIGFPDALTENDKFALVEKADIRKLFKPRKHDAYKYDFGKVLIIAGSRGMSGAAFLTAKAALRIGAGLVKVAIPKSVAHVIENTLPEAMTLRMDETHDGTLTLATKDSLLDYMHWADAVAIGPGISQQAETLELISELLKKLDRPAVIDADAIIALAGQFELIRSVSSEIVFTPHLGEFATFSQTLKDRIFLDRVPQLKLFSCKLNKTILLKGSPTVIACPNEQVFVNSTGNPGMATAGSGDVLTGIIAGLLGQGLSSEQAAYAGAYVHGLAGDLAKNEKTEMGLIASDIIDFIPGALTSLFV